MTVTQVLKGHAGLVAEVLLQRVPAASLGSRHVQVAVAGDGSAGKSSLVGVLLTGARDNGRGSARTHVSPTSRAKRA